MKLPFSYPPIRKPSKSTQAQICSRQERELIALRAKVATLRAAVAGKPSVAPGATGKAAERAAAAVLIAGISIGQRAGIVYACQVLGGSACTYAPLTEQAP